MLVDAREVFAGNYNKSLIHETDLNFVGAVVKISCALSGIFKELPFTEFPDIDSINYRDKELEIRKNVRLIRGILEKKEDVEGFIGKITIVPAHKTRSIHKEYKKIYSALPRLTDEQATDCIEYCFEVFNEKVESYKESLKERLHQEELIQRFGKVSKSEVEEFVPETIAEDGGVDSDISDDSQSDLNKSDSTIKTSATVSSSSISGSNKKLTAVRLDGGASDSNDMTHE